MPGAAADDVPTRSLYTPLYTQRGIWCRGAGSVLHCCWLLGGLGGAAGETLATCAGWTAANGQLAVAWRSADDRHLPLGHTQGGECRSDPPHLSARRGGACATGSAPMQMRQQVSLHGGSPCLRGMPVARWGASNDPQPRRAASTQPHAVGSRQFLESAVQFGELGSADDPRSPTDVWDPVQTCSDDCRICGVGIWVCWVN
jgi:hypothetical protein